MHTGWLDLLEKLCVIIPAIWAITWAVVSRLLKSWKTMLTAAIQEQLRIQNEGLLILIRQVTPNGGTENTLGDWVVRLAKKTDGLIKTTEAQNVVLEAHTRTLRELTGVTSETKNHLDRKILHESRQGVEGHVDSPLAGTALVGEIQHELENGRDS